MGEGRALILPVCFSKEIKPTSACPASPSADVILGALNLKLNPNKGSKL